MKPSKTLLVILLCTSSLLAVKTVFNHRVRERTLSEGTSPVFPCRKAKLNVLITGNPSLPNHQRQAENLLFALQELPPQKLHLWALPCTRVETDPFQELGYQLLPVEESLFMELLGAPPCPLCFKMILILDGKLVFRGEGDVHFIQNWLRARPELLEP